MLGIRRLVVAGAAIPRSIHVAFPRRMMNISSSSGSSPAARQGVQQLSKRPSSDPPVPPMAAFLTAFGFVPFALYAASHRSGSDKNAPGIDNLLTQIETSLHLPAGLLDAFRAHDQAGVRKMFLTYGSVILSFMGAIHWGATMVQPGGGNPRSYVFSVVPSLMGWGAVNMDEKKWAFAAPYYVLTAGFLGVYIADQFMVEKARLLPLWYPKLRTPVTAAVLTACVAAGWRGTPDKSMRAAALRE